MMNDRWEQIRLSVGHRRLIFGALAIFAIPASFLIIRHDITSLYVLLLPALVPIAVLVLWRLSMPRCPKCDIKLKTHRGNTNPSTMFPSVYWCKSCQSFADRQIPNTCPECGAPNALKVHQINPRLTYHCAECNEHVDREVFAIATSAAKRCSKQRIDDRTKAQEFARALFQKLTLGGEQQVSGTELANARIFFHACVAKEHRDVFNIEAQSAGVITKAHAGNPSTEKQSH